MPFGSSARFTACIAPMAAPECWSRRKGVFASPIPCSPEIAPPSATIARRPSRTGASFSLVSLLQVSVSVRPDCLSESGTDADAGHHSRSCADFFVVGLPGTTLAPMTLAVASRLIG